MQVNPIQAGNLRNKIKGFTLVELIVVIAIIAILAGMGNLGVQTYVRNAKLEALNDRAQLVYTAFQDMLLDCEINQDNSVFEPRGRETAPWSMERTDDIIGAVIFFRISQYDYQGHPNVNHAVGLGDEIHIMTTHKNNVIHQLTPNICSISVFAEGSTSPEVTGGAGQNHSADHGAYYWKKLDSYISGRLDNSATGTYCVSVDLENYQVLSVICRDVLPSGKDPKTGLYATWEVTAEAGGASKGLGNFISAYDEGSPLVSGGVTIKPPQQTFIVKDKEQQRAICKRTGVNMGAYPYGDDLYSNVTSRI